MDNPDRRNFALGIRYSEIESLRRTRSAPHAMRKLRISAIPVTRSLDGARAAGYRIIEVQAFSAAGGTHVLSIASPLPGFGSPGCRPLGRHAGPCPRSRHRRPSLGVAPGDLDAGRVGSLGPGAG